MTEQPGLEGAAVASPASQAAKTTVKAPPAGVSEPPLTPMDNAAAITPAWCAALSERLRAATWRGAAATAAVLAAPGLLRVFKQAADLLKAEPTLLEVSRAPSRHDRERARRAPGAGGAAISRFAAALFLCRSHAPRHPALPTPNSLSPPYAAHHPPDQPRGARQPARVGDRRHARPVPRRAAAVSLRCFRPHAGAACAHGARMRLFCSGAPPMPKPAYARLLPTCGWVPLSSVALFLVTAPTQTKEPAPPPHTYPQL